MSSSFAKEFELDGVEQVVIFGSWAARYQGQVGPPPNDVDVLVVGAVDRADVYEAADRAGGRLGIQVNPLIRTSMQWAEPQHALVAQVRESPHVKVLDRDGERG